jgi:hypothetical protein
MAVEPLKVRRVGSWLPTDCRAQLSKDFHYLHLIIDGKLFSLRVDLLAELLQGERPSLRLSRYVVGSR